MQKIELPTLLSLFILAPSGQLEGNPLGGRETAESVGESSTGKGAEAGLPVDVADGSNAKAFGFNFVHVASRSCWEAQIEKGVSDIQRKRTEVLGERWLRHQDPTSEGSHPIFSMFLQFVPAQFVLAGNDDSKQADPRLTPQCQSYIPALNKMSKRQN